MLGHQERKGEGTLRAGWAPTKTNTPLQVAFLWCQCPSCPSSEPPLVSLIVPADATPTLGTDTLSYPLAPAPPLPPPPAEGDSSHTALFAAMRPLSTTPGAALAHCTSGCMTVCWGIAEPPGPEVNVPCPNLSARCMCLGSGEKRGKERAGAGRAGRRRPGGVDLWQAGVLRPAWEGSPSLFTPLRWSSRRRGVWEVGEKGLGRANAEKNVARTERGHHGLGCWRGRGRGCGHVLVPRAPGSRRGRAHTSPRPDASRPPGGALRDRGLRGAVSTRDQPRPRSLPSPRHTRWRLGRSRPVGPGMTQSGAGHEDLRPPAPAEERLPPPLPCGRPRHRERVLGYL